MLRPQSFFEVHARYESEIEPRARRVGVGVAHIAFLIGFTLDRNRTADNL